MSGAALFLQEFVSTRYFKSFKDRNSLDSHQSRCMGEFLNHDLPRAPFYQRFKGKPLSALPPMDKSSWMANFDTLNTVGARLEDVLPVAMAAELDRRSPPLWNSYAVGLSSGTSGVRGVFLVGPNERIRWSAILLAKTLPGWILKISLSRSIRIAFFHRAPNPLYETLRGRRIQFTLFGLWRTFDALMSELQHQSPDVLVAPAQVLQRIAEAQQQGIIRISPRLIVSVAEVLDAQVADFVSSIFQQTIHQIYQATEGLLATTCPLGNLHLNEEHVYFEKEWLDDGHRRFVPIITDFTRRTQFVVRYRLNDILRSANRPCACGSAAEMIDGIEGRSDDILYFRSKNVQGLQPIYPDFFRRIFLLLPNSCAEYQVRQLSPDMLEIALTSDSSRRGSEQRVATGLRLLASETQTKLPTLRFVDYYTETAQTKRRRVRRLFSAPGLIP